MDTLPPATRTRHDKPGAGFNAGHLGGHHTWRTGWAGSEVWIDGKCLTNLRHARAGYGREDPRLFTFRDRPHLAFTGVEGFQGPTSQLYARLRDDLSIERIFYPHYTGRKSWEKNWGFFEWENELYAVYTIQPHVVLHVRDDQAFPFAETPGITKWSGGEPRGGAPPVRVGNYFYSWFHGARDVGGRRRYNVGLYKFEARPPFRSVAMTPDPLLWADPKTCPADVWADVIFPGGASLHDGIWTVTCGMHDRWFETMTWRHEDVERLLVSPADTWPLYARWLAKLRKPDDAGLGDTIARNLDRFGADALKRLFKKLTGQDCGCSNRQAALNARFRYN